MLTCMVGSKMNMILYANNGHLATCRRPTRPLNIKPVLSTITRKSNSKSRQLSISDYDNAVIDFENAGATV